MISSHSSVQAERTVAAFTRYPPRAPSSRVRFHNFEEYLNRAGWSVRYFPFHTEQFVLERQQGFGLRLSLVLRYAIRIYWLLAARRADVFWIEKEALQGLPFWAERLFLYGVPTVYDFDDAVHLAYERHRSPLIRALLGKKILRSVAASSATVAGNTFLYQYFSTVKTDGLWQIPSCVELSPVGPAEKGTPSQGSIFRVGWTGTPATYKEYLAPLLPALSEVLTEVGGNLVVIGAGNKIQTYPNTRYYDWSLEREDDLLAQLDLGLMPLKDDAWSRGKCGYKILLYLARGIPVVVSPVGVNADIVTHGSNGWQATEISEWQHFIRRCAGDQALAVKMGRTGRQLVEDSFSYEANHTALLEVLGIVAENR